MIDTRTKIVPDAEARARVKGQTVVAAWFDPFTSTHARRLRELALTYGPLTVCICDPAQPLLPARARAELAAACRSVGSVVIGEGHLAEAAGLIDERAADSARRDALILHVRQRQKAVENA